MTFIIYCTIKVDCIDFGRLMILDCWYLRMFIIIYDNFQGSPSKK
jgi:hypothetical protein